jgi:hypothetical protein
VKSNGVINFKHVDAFNDLMNKWGFMEIKDPTRTFTWSNNLADPILAKLDRILVTADWDTKYPLAKMKMLRRGVSDHCSLRIDFRGGGAQFEEPLFRFEKWWLEIDDFTKPVKKSLGQ